MKQLRILYIHIFLSRLVIYGFEKCYQSKYSSKLFTLIWAPVELNVWPCVRVYLACWNSLSFLQWLQENYSGFSILTYCNSSIYHNKLVKAHKKFVYSSKAVPDTPNLCYFKNLMNLLCCRIIPRYNHVFSLRKLVLLVISTSVTEILGVLRVFFLQK